MGLYEKYFNVGYFLKFEDGQIYYSHDQGDNWEKTYTLDMIEEQKTTNAGSMSDIYYTFYTSLSYTS